MELQIKNGRRYGYIPDVPDHRDFGIAAALNHPGKLAPSVDLESFCGPVRDQGSEGSCTAHAGVGMREFLYRKLSTYEKTKLPSAPLFSPAFLYYQERLLNGSLDQGDCGSDGRTVCQALNKFGVCQLQEEVYVPGQFNTPPNDAQLADALLFTAGAYHRLATVQDMKTCLASGYVFAIGFTVYDSFERIGADGLWTPNTASEEVLGGHEVLAIGYDDSVNGGSFKIRNSWGSGWGQNGNFWMRYSDGADPAVLMDAWFQHLGRAW